MEHTEEHDQLIWRFATDDVTTEELGEIEELQNRCSQCAEELDALARQKEEEARRRAEAEKSSGAVFWIIGLIVVAVGIYFFV